MSKIKNGVNGIVCAYCGKEKKEVMFVIGASSKPDWCMVAGTGKMTCPDCYTKAMNEGRSRIDNHVKSYNESVDKFNHNVI